jgi:hypothetical protein
MFEQESIWIREVLNLMPKTKKLNLLNVGSSTKRFREAEQPYIHENIFKPIDASVAVVHLDVKKDEGVDKIGDLTDRDFLTGFAKQKYDIVLCSNLLEHVPNPNELCAAIELCCSAEGVIIVTVQYLYPYHNDPIDTMFRPTIDEVVSMFPNRHVLVSENLVIQDSHYSMLKRSPLRLFIFVMRLLSPFYKPGAWLKIVSGLPKLFSRFQVTCVALSSGSERRA